MVCFIAVPFSAKSAGKLASPAPPYAGHDNAAAKGFQHSGRREQVMRIRLVLALFAFSAAAQASSSYRVGNELLTAGDSAARVTELLGKPSYKSHRSGSRGASHRSGSHGSSHRNSSHSSGHSPDARSAMDDAHGEQWQYRRDDRIVTVTIIDGKVSDIDDRRH
jgi:Protein of unknown function (DUF2845)